MTKNGGNYALELKRNNNNKDLDLVLNKKQKHNYHTMRPNFKEIEIERKND